MVANTIPWLNYHNETIHNLEIEKKQKDYNRLKEDNELKGNYI